ncbi:hypothetical protein A2U01_0115663 [Trifolium medium]|uniref:Uncharacterized protein n=1 Tax=Trifolium medium TaxID=97028 RepID=A0A392W622_9FABA|nr:hypothetical protein [Trifolium medium]
MLGGVAAICSGVVSEATAVRQTDVVVSRWMMLPCVVGVYQVMFPLLTF